jgi:hypothetical protein
MSIEVWQFPMRGTQRELAEHLISLDYRRGENPFRPGPRGTINLFWDDLEEFKSANGIDASILPLDKNSREIWETSGKWAIRTRTAMGSSSFDKEHQNETVRSIRKLFGGSFHNDHFGKNRYIKIHRPTSTPQGRGIYALLARLDQELGSLAYALPEEKMQSLSTPQGVITEKNDKNGILALVKENDPSRIVYNALIPYLVAILEHLFQSTFEILFRFDTSAQSKAQLQNRRIPISDVFSLARGEIKIEQIVASWFTFQNMDSIQAAFKEFHEIDVWKALRDSERTSSDMPRLADLLGDLISARHGVVHDLTVNRALDKATFLNLVELTKTILYVVQDEIEKKLGHELSSG